MAIERYLVSEEEVVKIFTKLRVGRGKEGLVGGYTGYVTNQRVIFLKRKFRGGAKMHEIILDFLSSIDWENRRRISDWAPIAGIFLIFYGLYEELEAFYFGIIVILAWYFFKIRFLVIYGGGKEISVHAGTLTVLEDLMTTIRNQQVLAKKFRKYE